MTSSSWRCCVPGCVESGERNHTLHGFPNPTSERELFNTWLYAIGGDIVGLGSSFIYKYSRVCRRHFEDKYLYSNNRISTRAIPTLHMPDSRTLQKYSFGKRRQMQEVQDDALNSPSSDDTADLYLETITDPYSDIVTYEPISSFSNELKGLSPDKDTASSSYTTESLQPRTQPKGLTSPEGSSEPRNDNGVPVKLYLSGAARRRRVWWINRGKSEEEADVLCQKSFSKLQEHQEVRDWMEKLKTKSTKRMHSERDSLKDQPRKIARMKRTKPPIRDVPESCRIGIEDAGRSMNSDEIQLLQEGILQCIDSCSRGEGPKFMGSAVRAGCLVLTCVDSATRDWVASRLPTLKPWVGADLRLLEEKDLPKPYYATIWIPDPKLDSKTILHRLQAQNIGVVNDQWKIVNTKVENTGQTMTLSFDEVVLECLKKQNFRLFFGFRDIPIRMKTPLKKEGERAEVSTPAPTPAQNPAVTTEQLNTQIRSASDDGRGAGWSVRGPAGDGEGDVVANLRYPTHMTSKPHIVYTPTTSRGIRSNRPSLLPDPPMRGSPSYNPNQREWGPVARAPHRSTW